MDGYSNAPLSEKQAKMLNERQRSIEPAGFDPRQPEVQGAMIIGSMFGWEVPGIDPANNMDYDGEEERLDAMAERETAGALGA